MTEALATPAYYHAGPWTIAEVLELPDNGVGYELIDGRLVATPVPPKPHQLAAKLLERLLDDAAPSKFEANRDVNLRIRDELLIPDIMVATSESIRGPEPTMDPGDVVLVVEIMSPSNTEFDRVWKPRRYAEGGIPTYLEVDLDPPGAVAYQLRGKGYVRVAEARAGETLELTEPYPIRFDPRDLAGRRG
ncbi:MAG TPA: Uma2 family endonuclease [Streptosporangiaceae bacterium]